VPRIVLPNGLVVLLAEDHNAPVVSMQLRYRTGTRDDPPARSGLAGLVPRLMMQATKHVGKGDYQRMLDAAGSYASGWTVGMDRTMINVSVPSERIALPLWLLSDQMGFLVERLDSEMLDEQVKSLLNAHTQTIDNAPAGRVPGLVISALYPAGHPYHRGSFDISPALTSISPDDVRAFVEAHYRPEQAILSIVGDFDSVRALALVNKYFAPIGKSGDAAHVSGDVPSLDHEVRMVVAARVELPSVTIAWPTAPSQAPDDAPLDLLASALAGPRAGLLRWKLVDELKIAASVDARQASREFGSEFWIQVTATRGHGPRELVSAVDAVLGRLQTAPPNDYVTQGAMTGYLMGPLFAVERSSARADRFAECEEYGVQGSCITHWLARYTSVTAADLSAVAARELPLSKRVVAEVYPSAEAPIAGELRDSPPAGQ